MLGRSICTLNTDSLHNLRVAVSVEELPSNKGVSSAKLSKNNATRQNNG